MKSFKERFDFLQSYIKKAKNSLLIVHPNPDGDALGAAFALSEYLKKQLNFSDADIFSVDEPGKQFSNLFCRSSVLTKVDFKKYDTIFFIDRADFFYHFKDRFSDPIPAIISIDHHPHDPLPKVFEIDNPKASATSEILYEFFKHQKFSINQKISQYLLTGIYTDTGGFRHNNTSPRALEIASSLMKNGALITKINRELFANKSLNAMKLWGIALERVQVNPKNGMAASFVTQDDLEKCGATIHDLDGISEVLNSISGAKFSIVLSERESGKIRASLRSEEYKKIDVSKIAKDFFGGGHKLASGFEIDGKLKQSSKGGWMVE